MGGKKRRIMPLLFVGLTLLLTACNLFIEGDYAQISAHDEEVTPEPIEEADYVVYRESQLKNTILTIIRSRVESSVVRVSIEDYDLEDVQNAVTTALEEISVQPLAAYAVSGIIQVGYQEGQGQAYTDVELTVSYQKTEEQISNLKTVNSGSAAAAEIQNMLVEGETYLAMYCPSNSANTGFIENTIKTYYYDNPLLALLLPRVQVGIYPSSGSGAQRIVEIELEFGYDTEALSNMRMDLQDAVLDLARLSADGEAETVIALGDALNGWTTQNFDYSFEQESDLTELRPMSYTAYGALVEQSATSEGYAMAYKAMCDYLGIECYVVQGGLNGNRHVWNIVAVEDDFYHMDIYMTVVLGQEAAYLRSDAGMMDGGYTWDFGSSERCEGDLSYPLEEPEPEEDLDPEAGGEE